MNLAWSGTMPVSIPHRHPTNAQASDDDMMDDAFRFLIGTLQTWAALAQAFYMWVFRFLIGTLQTRGLSALVDGLKAGFDSS